MGCGRSKPETVHDPKQNNKHNTIGKVHKRSHGSHNETFRVQNKNQHGGENKVKVESDINHQNKAEVQHDNKTQNRTTDSGNSSQSNLHTTYDYQKMDQHARKAPKNMNNSAEELVTYLSSVSKDLRMLVRGFFVWSSENIRYDVDGYFGRSEMAPTDPESVMKNGRSVCEGYARVFEMLCRKAGIPVKKISGFAKGYSYSPSTPLTLNTRTNHAWNAVQLEGKWYLLDCTWGAGHLDSKSNGFKKEFEEFYFLTDPKQFVSAHFPYMDNNMEESQKWQLLSKPLSLEEFNRNIKYGPQAFKIGAKAVSHTNAYFEMKNELKMTFKSVGKEDIIFSSRLMYVDGKWLKEQRNATFGYYENGLYNLLVYPQREGMHELSLFGKLASNEMSDSSSQILTYKFNCTEIYDSHHEYPVSYETTFIEKCMLHEPLKGNLPEKTEIQFCISAPYLNHIQVQRKFLTKEGIMFKGEITTPEKGFQVTIFGTRGDQYSRMYGLYGFHTV